MLPCTCDGAGAVVNESSLRAVRPPDDDTMATLYAVDEARPLSSTLCRTAGVSTLCQSTGSLPAGPHCSSAVDTAGVVHPTVAVYEETCTDWGGGGGGGATACVVAGEGARLPSR